MRYRSAKLIRNQRKADMAYGEAAGEQPSESERLAHAYGVIEKLRALDSMYFSSGNGTANKPIEFQADASPHDATQMLVKWSDEYKVDVFFRFNSFIGRVLVKFDTARREFSVEELIDETAEWAGREQMAKEWLISQLREAVIAVDKEKENHSPSIMDIYRRVREIQNRVKKMRQKKS